MAPARPRLVAAQCWILISTWCGISGWMLSAVGQLGFTGYAISFLMGGLLLYLWLSSDRFGALWASGGFRASGEGRGVLRKYVKRFRKPLPLLYLLAVGVAFVGGALYTPNNYDALTYRLPRVLKWLAEGRWHWITTANHRMNYSGVGFEWLMAPLLLIGHGERFIFLINIISELLLPGLVFSSFTALGIERRVAWAWMWLLPLGYCFILQAGSIGNDLFSAVYFLAAITFARRAATYRSIADLWLAMLAAALMTGAKASNLPLLLPCFLAAWPALPLLKRRIFGTAAVVIVAAAASFLPVAGFNTIHTGDWSGDPLNEDKLKATNSVAGVIGNTLEALSGNLQPAVCPIASQYGAETDQLIASPGMRNIVRHFPRLTLIWGEIAIEEGAGAGLGLTVLLIAGVVFAAAHWKIDHPVAQPVSGAWIVAGTYIALIAYMTKIGSEATPRLLATYYPLLLAAPLLHPSAAMLVRKRWWKLLACLSSLSVAPALILSPARPLWPYRTVTRYFEERFPNSHLMQRAVTVYSVYRQRADNLGPLRKYIPPGTRLVGFIASGDETEISLWRPFGSRRVLDITTPEQLESSRDQCRFIVASDDGIRRVFGNEPAEVVREHHAHILGSEKIVVKASVGEEEWYVIQLDS